MASKTSVPAKSATKAPRKIRTKRGDISPPVPVWTARPELLPGFAGRKPSKKFHRRSPEWLVTTRQEEDDSFAVGGTLDEALADIVAQQREHIEGIVPREFPTADDALAHNVCDFAVWGPGEFALAAVVLCRPGGVQVVRFDAEIPEAPEAIGPNNMAYEETPRPAPPPEPPAPKLTDREKQVLDYAHKIGLMEAEMILYVSEGLKMPIRPGDVSEARARLMLMPEDRFPWRRAAGFTTTDDEAKETMERIRAESPGHRVATVLTTPEKEILELIRTLGTTETKAVLYSAVSLDIPFDQLVARLVRPDA